MKNGRIIRILAASCMFLFLAACAKGRNIVSTAPAAAETAEITAADTAVSSPTVFPEPTETALPENTAAASVEQTDQEDTDTMRMKIGDADVQVKWEENESVNALRTLCEKDPLVIKMSMYGGFEQVGPIGTALPRNDVQTVTSAGDIVLYSGNQIVVFYGSNSWAYTRLGHITDKTPEEMTALLANGDVEITISTASQTPEENPQGLD